MYITEHLEKLLWGNPWKYKYITSAKYVHSRKEGKLELLGIDNATHSKDIFLCEHLFPPIPSCYFGKRILGKG